MVLFEVAGFAPHDGVRWWIVSNAVCGVGKRACVPTVFSRSIYLRLVGTSLPAFSAAEIQIRHWPPLSIDSPRQISSPSASASASAASDLLSRADRALCAFRASMHVAARPSLIISLCSQIESIPLLCTIRRGVSDRLRNQHSKPSGSAGCFPRAMVLRS